ncbi:MAG: hypothetical protein M1830_002732 [Pleopsidium flavum]|nr:MAG: hypothetical protein M1830_002732 [Pleopsidium flavum]
MAIQKCNIPGKEDLSHAYQLAVMQKPLQYWEDIMIVHRRQLHRNAVANENIEVAREGGISANSIEAKSEISFRIPPGFVSNEGDKPENSLFLTPPPSARKGVKREFEDGMSPEDMKALYEDSDTEEALERSRARKRVKVETLPTQRIHSSEHVVKIEVQAPAHDEKVQIYVDNPFKIFVISKENVKQSPLLKSLLSYQPSEGWCIMSPVLSRFHAKAFEAVVEYLNGAEYTPRLLNDGKADVRLENITTNSAKAAQVLNSGILYCMAGKLQLRAMKDLALRKLRVLSPYPPSMFIPIVGLVFQHGCARDDVEIRELLVEHIAEDYWELQKKEPRQFMEVMTTFPELDASVTARRAKGPKREVAFIKIEDD